MPRVRNYKEGKAFTVTFKFFDEDYVAASPTTARYRIDCLTNKRYVRDWTEIDPVSQEVDILITPDDQAIINSRNTVERRQIVVQTNYGTDSQDVQTDEWTLENIQGVT